MPGQIRSAEVTVKRLCRYLLAGMLPLISLGLAPAASAAPAAAKSPPVTTIPSLSISGWGFTGLTSTDRFAAASWTVPAVHCLDPSDPAASDHSRVGVWVGLIGASQSAARLTRAGTEVECSAGVKIKDAAFFTEARTNGGFRPEWLFDVRAGDKITAVVQYEGLSHGRRKFDYVVVDHTNGRRAAANVTIPSKALTERQVAYTAAAVVERARASFSGPGPLGGLAKFKTPIRLNHLVLGVTGRGLIRWEMFSRTGRRLARNTGIRSAGPAPTAITGRFRVIWEHWR
jgi:hypothetical protein